MERSILTPRALVSTIVAILWIYDFKPYSTHIDYSSHSVSVLFY